MLNIVSFHVWYSFYYYSSVVMICNVVCFNETYLYKPVKHVLFFIFGLTSIDKTILIPLTSPLNLGLIELPQNCIPVLLTVIHNNYTVI